MTENLKCYTCGQKLKEKVVIFVKIRVNDKDFDVFTAVKGQLHFTTLPSGNELETQIKDSRRTIT